MLTIFITHSISFQSQKPMDLSLRKFRLVAWAAIALRMLKNSTITSDYTASSIVLFGALTTMVPAWAHSWFDEETYVRWRTPVLFFDNILQVVLGCFTHAHIYPETASSWQTASTWRAVAVVMTGSGVSWLNMSGLLGSLVFRFAFAQQATIAIIMLLASPSMCARSFSLQKGYATVHSRLIHSFLVQGVRRLLGAPVVEGLEGGAEAFDLAAESAEHLCLTYQHVVILLLGFIVPTLYIFWREMRSRAVFVNSVRQDMDGVQVVKLNPSPSLMNYWTFIIPAVLRFVPLFFFETNQWHSF